MSFNRMAGPPRASCGVPTSGGLRAAQQLAESAIDSLYDPVVVTDADGRVTRLNRAAEEIFGPESAGVGQPISSLAAGKRHRHGRLAGHRVGPPDAARYRGERRAAHRHRQRPRLSPAHDTDARRDGTLLGSVTLLEDVTHLREIDRVKSEFIAVASHELRTPLTSALMGDPAAAGAARPET